MSCIDLVFNSQPNLLIVSGVHPSLHLSCYYQKIYATFDLGIVYPISYERNLELLLYYVILVLMRVLFDNRDPPWMNKGIKKK